jgi:hypothetical protein
MSRQSGITLDIQRIALDYGMSLEGGTHGAIPLCGKEAKTDNLHQIRQEEE